jgi:hypothetical protein
VSAHPLHRALLVWLKEKEQRYAELKGKITARRGKAAATP